MGSVYVICLGVIPNHPKTVTNSGIRIEYINFGSNIRNPEYSGSVTGGCTDAATAEAADREARLKPGLVFSLGPLGTTR